MVERIRQRGTLVQPKELIISVGFHNVSPTFIIREDNTELFDQKLTACKREMYL